MSTEGLWTLWARAIGHACGEQIQSHHRGRDRRRSLWGKMSIFEQIPPWGQQQQAPNPFNPAPQIMSPYQRGQQAPMQPPQLPQPPQDPSGATTASPQGAMGGVASMLGNPQSSQGPGGMLALLAAMQKANAPITDASGAPSHINVTGSQMPSSGGLMQWLSSLFGGSGAT